MAVMVNDAIVRQGERDSKSLREGDRIEILQMVGGVPSALDGNQLPVIPPSPNDFALAQVSVSVRDLSSGDSFNVLMTLETLTVPEPGLGVLVLAGLLCVVRRRRSDLP